MDDLINRQTAIEELHKCQTYLFDSGDQDRKIFLEDAECVIRALPSAWPRWIPVTERLPKQGQEVICQCRASIIDVLKLDANGDWYKDAEHCYMSGFVIAWMPLPKEYRETGDE